MTFKLTSSAFVDGAEIPRKYTCDGAEISPPLEWSGVPGGTRSLSIVLEDPDAPDPAAPETVWVHWIVYNIPPFAPSLPEGVGVFPAGAIEGRNDWGRADYGGPCPPIGRHRYVHTIYALDIVLHSETALTKAQLEKRIAGHVLRRAELVGTYQRS